MIPALTAGTGKEEDDKNVLTLLKASYVIFKWTRTEANSDRRIDRWIDGEVDRQTDISMDVERDSQADG